MSANPEELLFLGYEADEAGIAAAERAASDVRSVLKTRQGRRVLFRILGESRILQASFAQDPAVTAYNEGQRSVGLKLLATIHDADPTAYVRMLEEAREEASNG
jgi:hypothetical protein